MLAMLVMLVRLARNRRRNGVLFVPLMRLGFVWMSHFGACKLLMFWMNSNIWRHLGLGGTTRLLPADQTWITRTGRDHFLSIPIEEWTERHSVTRRGFRHYSYPGPWQKLIQSIPPTTVTMQLLWSSSGAAIEIHIVRYGNRVRPTNYQDDWHSALPRSLVPPSSLQGSRRITYPKLQAWNMKWALFPDLALATPNQFRFCHAYLRSTCSCKERS